MTTIYDNVPQLLDSPTSKPLVASRRRRITSPSHRWPLVEFPKTQVFDPETHFQKAFRSAEGTVSAASGDLMAGKRVEVELLG